jgi:hypothetical protein
MNRTYRRMGASAYRRAARTQRDRPRAPIVLVLVVVLVLERGFWGGFDFADRY